MTNDSKPRVAVIGAGAFGGWTALRLQEKGADVIYNDPLIPVLQPIRKYSFTLESTELTAETLAIMDCILLATDHSAYDYQFILDHADLIIDTRNAFNGLKGAAEKVVQA